MLSWSDNAGGNGHVNLRTNEWVVQRMGAMGYVHDEAAELALRHAVTDIHWGSHLATGAMDGSVRLHDHLLVRDGVFLRESIHAELTRGPYPVRGVEECLADLEAQIAANARGCALLIDLAEEQGLAVVSAYMGYVQDDAEAAMRAAIAELPDGAHRFVDYLDEGAPIAVTVEIDGDGARIDFAGTGPSLAGNLNAPRAVVLAATLYVFRTLIARPIPLNAGCLRPLEVSVPPGSLLDP